jgi:D-alanyl-D-alanine carboxypeptidase
MCRAMSRSGQLWRIRGTATLAIGLALALVLSFTRPAAAAPTSSAIVIDAASGQVLLQSNADAPTYPASLTKMMTLYLLFEAMQKGAVKLDQPLPVSVNAASMPATNLALSAGDTITVATAIQAMIIRSANDVAVVVAEGLSGSEAAFAQKMNAKALALGMTHTVFRNPNGLPDPWQHTTARDIATLALALHRDFPQYYPYFAQVRFSFHGRTYVTHNRFMLHYPGADGLKTGYIHLSGFNLAASAMRNGRRIVAVIMGGRSPSMRDAAMWALLDQGFGTATPKTQNNALLLASVGNAGLLPILKPGNDNDTEGDATDEGDSTLNAMSPQIAGLPTAPTAPLPSTQALQSKTGSDIQTAALAPFASTTAPQPAPKTTTREATTSLAPQIPVVPALPETPVFGISSASVPLPALRPVSAEPDGVSDGVVSVAVDAKRFWGVQVGAFSRYTPARLAAVKAQQNLPFPIKNTRIAVDEGETRSGKLYRARLVGLAQNEATDACRKLRARQIPCLVVQSNTAVAMVNGQ